jgi:hypothetical protein
MKRSTSPANTARAVHGAGRLMAAAMLFSAFAFPARAQGSPAPLVGAPNFGACLASIEAIGPRAEGSRAEAAAFAYIEAYLRAAGIDTSSSDFSDAREGYSTSRIVEGRMRGSRDDELAVIVPVDSWIDSPDPAEGAYGIALALCESARLSARARAGLVSPVSIRFVFLGAEKRGRMAEGQVASLGSATWLSRHSDGTRLAALYLDVGAEPASIAIRGAGKGVLSPYWLFDAARRSLEASGISYSLEANRIQAYRLGLARDYGPAAPYLETGMPAIELRGESSIPGDAFLPADFAARKGETAKLWFGAFMDGFVRDEAGGFADSWESHYFIFQIGRKALVLREKTYVAFLVLLLAIVASSFLIATMARRGATRQLLRRAPAFGSEVLALFMALALVFLAGKGVAGIDAILLGSRDAWQIAPRVFAIARIISSFLLFLALLSFLVEKRALSPNPHFYEFAALLCLAVDLIVFSAMDLSASFFFVWAFVFVEISLAVRNRWATMATYILMYAPLLVAAGELAARPDPYAYRMLIAPAYFGVLALSALTLPFFVFTASPLLFFARPGAAARKKAVAIFAIGAFAVESFALVFTIAEAPLGGPGRKDLRISETIDQDSGEYRIELSGRRRLGKGSLDREGTTLGYESRADKAYLRGEDSKERISVSEESSPFLDRMDESIDIAFADPPYSVDMALEYGKDILIYDCSLPYKVSIDGTSASIYAGVNPGSDLRLSLTVPSSFRARLAVTANYLKHYAAYGQSSGSPLEDEGLAVKASFEIGSGGK